MGCTIGNVELYMGPKREIGDRSHGDDLRQVIIGFIEGAEKRLDIAVQELDDMGIARAVVAARLRKVRVRLVLEGDYLKAGKAHVDPFLASGKLERNRIIQNAALRAAVNLKIDFNTRIFHQKFIIRDGESVLTGSTNFTTTGVESNLNHVVILHDREVARAYSAEFREIMQGRFGKASKGHDEKPTETMVGGLPVKALFAPDHNPEMEIMKQMVNGRERIDFAVFTFARSSGIDNTMIRLVEAGMAVRGVLDGKQSRHDWVPAPEVMRAGAELYVVPQRGSIRKLHHKLMVIDRRIVVAGSFNYTEAATKLNDENIVVIGHPTKGDADAQRQFAGAALQEIDAIVRHHARPYELR